MSSLYVHLLPNKAFYSLCFIVLLFAACNQQVSSPDITTIPEETEADKAFANVYKPLDGKWKGQFKIYEASQPAPKDEESLYRLSAQRLDEFALRQVIDVEQEYISVSPYFQRVHIVDSYYDEGQKKTVKVESKGVNKVEDGKMSCIVVKPDETVIHEGSTDGSSTIIWQRQEKNPQKIEYFYETVSENTYEIFGWGYYTGDDATLMPRLWFHGKYTRVRS